MIEILNKILETLGSLDTSAILTTAAVVIEFILRMVPSEKPLGLIRLVVDSIRIVAQILTKAADLLDKVLPQRLKV